MNTTHKLTTLLLLSTLLLLFSSTTLAADPGTPYPACPGADSDGPGSLLVFNIYASSASNPTAENTRISVTNTDDQNDVSVHFYYIDGSTCSVADNYVCLTKNQTATIYASDIDPGTKGYILAMTTYENGLFNSRGKLLGDEYVRLATGHSAQLPAQALRNIVVDNIGPDGVLAILNAPRVLAIPSIPSLAEGNNTMLIVNRLGGSLFTRMLGIGSIFGVLYDQLENPYSWTSSGGCQLMGTLGPLFPRTTPRIGSVIPAGSVGWMKFYPTDALSVTGAYLNFNANTGNSATAFNGGRNLAQLTTNPSDLLVFPIFPSNCGFDDPPNRVCPDGSSGTFCDYCLDNPTDPQCLCTLTQGNAMCEFKNVIDDPDK